jgi:hypothetical protein
MGHKIPFFFFFFFKLNTSFLAFLVQNVSCFEAKWRLIFENLEYLDIITENEANNDGFYTCEKMLIFQLFALNTLYPGSGVSV